MHYYSGNLPADKSAYGTASFRIKARIVKYLEMVQLELINLLESIKKSADVFEKDGLC